MVGLPTLGGVDSDGDGISANGLIIAGDSNNEACRWTFDSESQQWVVEGLGDLIGGEFISAAYHMSSDGQVVVGEGSSAKGTEAFRWTPTNGMVGLGDLPGGNFFSQAVGCSQDGSIVVGQSAGKTGPRAFRWTAAKGMADLGILSKRKFSAAWACSADGSVVVGQSWGPSSGKEEAFRWTAATGMKGLGELPGGITYSEADGVSPDGSIVVGGSGTANGIEAFIWDAADGMRRVADYLADKGAIVPAGWTLRYANSVTVNNGVVAIAGVGINPKGDMEAWIAVVML
jgi:probable HAF family extracellular repeat protein